MSSPIFDGIPGVHIWSDPPTVTGNNFSGTVWEAPRYEVPTTQPSLLESAYRETENTAQVCRITRCMEFMTDEQIADLDRAFATPKITAAAIARMLYAEFGKQLFETYGIEDIKPKTAQRHRRGECGCTKEV